MALRTGQENPLVGFEVVWKPLDELLAARDPDNPREIDDAAMARLVHSISTYGFTKPILLNERTGLVVAGHQRIEAANILGLDSLPCVIGDYGADDAAALGVADNADYGHWDHGKFRETLERLKAKSFDLDDLCLPVYDLEALSLPLPTLPAPLGGADAGAAPPTRRALDRKFSVSYLASDEAALCAFLGADTLPPQNHLGAHILERIHALTV